MILSIQPVTCKILRNPFGVVVVQWADSDQTKAWGHYRSINIDHGLEMSLPSYRAVAAGPQINHYICVGPLRARKVSRWLRYSTIDDDGDIECGLPNWFCNAILCICVLICWYNFLEMVIINREFAHIIDPAIQASSFSKYSYKSHLTKANPNM